MLEAYGSSSVAAAYVYCARDTLVRFKVCDLPNGEGSCRSALPFDHSGAVTATSGRAGLCCQEVLGYNKSRHGTRTTQKEQIMLSPEKFIIIAGGIWSLLPAPIYFMLFAFLDWGIALGITASWLFAVWCLVAVLRFFVFKDLE